MNKFSLEVQGLSSWELERDFSTFEGAINHGQQHFSQNHWRIFDRTAGSHVYIYDPTASIENDARLDTERFAETSRWRQIFAEQAEAERLIELERRERPRRLPPSQPRTVAQTQRQSQQAQQAVRRSRLAGFNFVGDPPPILRSPVIVDFPQASWDDDIEPISTGVNWLKEGF